MQSYLMLIMKLYGQDKSRNKNILTLRLRINIKFIIWFKILSHDYISIVLYTIPKQTIIATRIF